MKKTDNLTKNKVKYIFKQLADVRKETMTSMNKYQWKDKF